MNLFKDLIDYITKLFQWWVVVMPWEQGIRVTFGKKMMLLEKGTYLKIPIVHAIYIQERRLRTINLPIQTISTSDGHAITVSCSVGYSINDIVKLYNTLYQPDMTISSIVASSLASQVSAVTLDKCAPVFIEKKLSEILETKEYGLNFDFIRITNFAIVKTFRLIQDQSYMYEGVDLTKQK